MEKSLNQYTRWLSESLPADLREELENDREVLLGAAKELAER